MAYFAWHPVKIIHEVVFCFTFSDEVDWWVCCSSNDGSVADKTHLFTWVLLPFQNYFIWSRLFPLLLRMVLRDGRYFGAGLSYCSVPRENHLINLKTMWSPNPPPPPRLGDIFPSCQNKVKMLRLLTVSKWWMDGVIKVQNTAIVMSHVNVTFI